MVRNELGWGEVTDCVWTRADRVYLMERQTNVNSELLQRPYLAW